jgi:hypothetical protein
LALGLARDRPVRFRHPPEGAGEGKHRHATGIGADGDLTGEGAYAEIFSGHVRDRDQPVDQTSCGDAKSMHHHLRYSRPEDKNIRIPSE